MLSGIYDIVDRETAIIVCIFLLFVVLVFASGEYDPYELGQKIYPDPDIQNEWLRLETSFKTLNQLLTGDHELDKTNWENILYKTLSDAEVALEMLKSRNRIVRKRSRSSWRSKPECVEQSA